MSGVLGKIMLDVDWCSVTNFVVLCRSTTNHRNEMEVTKIQFAGLFFIFIKYNGAIANSSRTARLF